MYCTVNADHKKTVVPGIDPAVFIKPTNIAKN